MLPRCGRVAHICEANKTVWELQQKSKRELEESQLPSKQKVEMMEQGFRGNCDSQASWGCAPALLNRIWVVSLRAVHAVFHMKHDTNKKASPCRLQATSRRQRKSFSVQQFFKNAAEVWASSPHLRSKFVFENCCSCCNCIYENCPIRNLISFMRQVANSDKATGQLQHAGRQKQGWNPLLPDEKDRFS